MAIKTQGTNLWYVDPDVGTVIEVGCPTSIDPGSGTPDKIEVTCINERKVKQYVSGLEDTSEAKIGINFDPKNASHKGLYDESVKDVLSQLDFVIGCSDGTDAPTYDGSSKTWTMPNTRSWLKFSGEISAFTFSFDKNDVVKSEITITRNGKLSFVPKA